MAVERIIHTEQVGQVLIFQNEEDRQMGTFTLPRVIALLCVVGLFSGCALTPQSVEITPTLNVASSDIGEGHSVAVFVVDERTSTEIGRRGTGAMRGAAITTSNDMVSVFSDAIVQNLGKLGFDAKSIHSFADSKQEEQLLRVDIRVVEYETSMGFWTGGVHVRGLVKATASFGGNTYEQLYRVDDEERVMVVPGADSNAQMINAAVSALLQKLFDDVGLLKFLSA